MTFYLIYTFREPELLARTIRRLYPSQVVVHVDAKVDEGAFRTAIDESDRARVNFVEERVKVNWGGYSQVTAIRRMVAVALRSAADDEYLVLLSGQDYPIKRPAQIEEGLYSEPRQQFMRFFLIGSSSNKYRSQISSRYFRDLRFLDSSTGAPRLRKARNAAIRMLEAVARIMPAPRPPAGFQVAQGVTHFAITAGYAAELESRVTPEIERYFHGVFVPEEKFYQSLAANNPTGSEGNKRIVPAKAEKYSGDGNWRYSNLHHIDPTLTRVFTSEDWDEVSGSEAYFLRKLESLRSVRLLDRIDHDLLDVGPSPETETTGTAEG